jgi:F-type H+-transporting ATPase subunit b
MLDFLTKLASAGLEQEIESEGLFESLGIDWKVLTLQLIAFVILVIILAKFIYPQINAMLDRRDKLISDAIEAAKKSEENAAKSEQETQAALGKARQEAEEIIETAKKESADMMTTTEFDAKKKADEIVRSAQSEIDKDIKSARQLLRKEVLGLVADATEKVAGAKLGSDDEKIVAEVLKGENHGDKN